ncbi:MAG: hypothetical protein EBY16_08785 [Gammaproteobacteria bacterium]|nr:hypothetical protein [Gammaproteobacteria bacterium]
MATKKPRKAPQRRRRAPRKAEALSKLENHYITLNEMYRAAKTAGFSSDVAFWLITEPGSSLPDWVNPTNKPSEIIPRIDPTDDEDED